MNRVFRRLLQINFNQVSRVNQLHLSSSTQSQQLKQANNHGHQGCRGFSTTKEVDESEETLEYITGGRDFEELTIDKYSDLIKNDQDRQTIEEILSEYEYIKYESGLVPSTIEVFEMKELLHTPKARRESSFNFILGKEINRRRRKLLRQQSPKATSWNNIQHCLDHGLEVEMGVRFDPLTGAPIYGEWRNSHFIRVRQQDYRCSNHVKLIAAHLFGQKLAVDCDFEYNLMDAKKIATDMNKGLACLRDEADPFDVNLCGLTSPLLKDYLNKLMTAFDPKHGLLGVNAHKETITEMFPKKKIIYISPKANEVLQDFDYDAVYVIPAIPKTYRDPGAVWKKCLRHGLKVVRLPLEGLVFKPQPFAKNLDLEESLKILSNFKETGDITSSVHKAVKPSRLKTQEEFEEDQEHRLKKLVSRNKKKFKGSRVDNKNVPW